MKIVYVITQATWGGAQAHLYSLIERQVKIGNTVTLISGIEGRLSDQIKKNLPQVKLVIISNLVRQVSLINDFKAIRALRKLLKRLKPDILHLHSSKAGMVGRLAALGLSMKVVFTVHGWGFTPGVSKKQQLLIKLVEKTLQPLTTYYICVSEFDQNIGLRGKVLKASKENYVVIHNGAPKPKEFDRRPATLPVRLVMTARFSKQKDQTSLIRAVKSLDKSKYHLSLVGDGETLEDNQRLVEELRLTDNVSFEGFKSDVSDSLIHNDVYILSTHYEGLPISIIEAMSYKLPIIATDVGGNKELVKDNGYLISSISDLTQRIQYLIDHPDLIGRLGNASYELYKNEYTLEHCLDKINFYYNELIK
ncbi:glycosyltransferase family 4 protein [Limosilactobacillus fermentum]|uniref:glycosyltransferase family 4 protein n=1 Tax=Limosilactobacillus fermentum TaxID=1613 RepID=UPI000D3D05EF|nr:glycosyltransferase family 4 protein [Limosilactobacillus fermentum]PTS37606.1 glycosyltransferase family 1 protein [Limosilactobacillus fermentum]